MSIVGRVVIIPFLHGKIGADGNLVEPDIEAIFERWLERHPEFRGKQRGFKIIRGTMHLVAEDVVTELVRVTAEYAPDLAAYDPSEDSDLYEFFLADDFGSSVASRHEIWKEQCAAAQRIESEYGTDKAMGYLIGEKLLTFLAVAENKPEWRNQIPHFVARIKEIFEPWQLADFFETPRRLGALGHTADEEAHELFRQQVDESDNIREDTRHLLMFEWARELLTDESAE